MVEAPQTDHETRRDKLIRLYLTTWWMPTVVSIIFFFVAISLGIVSSILRTSNPDSSIYSTAIFVTLVLSYLWPLSVLAIPSVGIYQLVKRDKRLGLTNIFLGLASILATIFLLFLGIAIT